MAKAKEETALALPSTSILATGGGGGGLSLPAHLQEDVGAGMETVKQFLKPGRIKTIQSNRTADFNDCEEGSVIITPTKILVAKNEERFWFVPLLMFAEYCTVNPIQTKGTLPMIRARSLDPMSEIARKARDPDLRKKDVCPENTKFNLKHVEYLVYICWIVNNPELAGTPVVLSFSGGEHKQGQMLANLLAARKTPRGQASIYSNVFQGVVPKQKRHAEGGDWYGINVTNPSGDGAPPPFVMDPDDHAKLKAAHQELVRLQAGQQIDVSEVYEDEEGDRTPSVPVGADGKEAF